MNRILYAQELRPTIDKWVLIKPKGFFTAKETTNPVKEEATEVGENLFQLYKDQTK